ncbi:hypothetical protein GX50_08180 [[Emmonsia] crescens]|uniref:Reverse transcriptase RNase H-like domain-containing protein n=1 Tax=[Emmonsia] crescens TaxID=73230 RepID=A0A2B7Z8C5_9EURO|nr:hypothetical protein GX50_08180 [Emmonsia crescens]
MILGERLDDDFRQRVRDNGSAAKWAWNDRRTQLSDYIRTFRSSAFDYQENRRSSQRLPPARYHQEHGGKQGTDARRGNQAQLGVERPILFLSCRLNPAERRYWAIELECLRLI